MSTRGVKDVQREATANAPAGPEILCNWILPEDGWGPVQPTQLNFFCVWSSSSTLLIDFEAERKSDLFSEAHRFLAYTT